MGYYIDPPASSKEEWLRINGTVIPTPVSAIDQEGFRPVCLVYNEHFTAAGICYSDRELMAFKQPDDHREKTWYLVPIEKLVQVCPLVGRQILECS